MSELAADTQAAASAAGGMTPANTPPAVYQAFAHMAKKNRYRLFSDVDEADVIAELAGAGLVRLVRRVKHPKDLSSLE